MGEKRGPKPDYQALGEAVKMWREYLGWSQNDVHARGGPSDAIVSKIESGTWESSRPAGTLAKLDKAFARHWPQGSAREILFRHLVIRPATAKEHRDLRAHGDVGALDQTPGQYVGATGDRVDEGRREDSAVLQAITAMSATLDQLLAGQREQSSRLDSVAADSRDTRDRLGSVEDAQRELSARVAKLEEPRP